MQLYSSFYDRLEGFTIGFYDVDPFAGIVVTVGDAVRL